LLNDFEIPSFDLQMGLSQEFGAIVSELPGAPKTWNGQPIPMSNPDHETEDLEDDIQLDPSTDDMNVPLKRLRKVSVYSRSPYHKRQVVVSDLVVSDLVTAFEVKITERLFALTGDPG